MYDPFAPWRLWLTHQQVMVNAMITIWQRSARAMQGTLMPGEWLGMVMEKPLAAGEAIEGMTRAINRRHTSPLQLGQAALKPYGKRTRANARRLTRKR